MNKCVVKLYLNETGKKAFKADIKTLYADADPKDITEKYIDENLFPMSLVSDVEVEQSFLDLQYGDYVTFVDENGNNFLGKVSYTDKRQIGIRKQDSITDSYFYNQLVYFNADGIEATRSKKKKHIERISQDEVAKYMEIFQKEPFLYILQMLGIEYDAATIQVPEWLTPEAIASIKDILNSAKFGDNNDEYDNDDDY